MAQWTFPKNHIHFHRKLFEYAIKNSPYRYDFFTIQLFVPLKNFAMPANNDHERVDFWDWRVVFDPWHFTVRIPTNSAWIFPPARIVGGKATSNSLWSLVYGMSYAIANNLSVKFNTERIFFSFRSGLNVQIIRYSCAFKFYFLFNKTTERCLIFLEESYRCLLTAAAASHST